MFEGPRGRGGRGRRGILAVEGDEDVGFGCEVVESSLCGFGREEVRVGDDEDDQVGQVQGRKGRFERSDACANGVGVNVSAYQALTEIACTSMRNLDNFCLDVVEPSGRDRDLAALDLAFRTVPGDKTVPSVSVFPLATIASLTG